MIILDQNLKEREKHGQPIRVGLAGAGFLARGITRQIHLYVSGMVVTVLCNCILEKAENICRDAAIATVEQADDPEQVHRLTQNGASAITRHRVTRSLSQDQLLTYDDVEIPKNRLAHKLRADQDARCYPKESTCLYRH